MAIVKILARHAPTYQSLIQYILNEAKIDRAEIYTQNLRSDTILGYVREFMENEAFRRQHRSDSVFLYHEILSFQSENTPITKQMLDDLVAKYMELRSETALCIGAVHRDKGNTVHCHFALSALHYRTGKSIGLSKAKLHELKTSFQEYHGRKYPEITKSFPNHGKGREYATHTQWHARQREQIVGAVRQCFAQASSQREFLELLRNRALHHYERNGRPAGILYEGQKFRFSRLLEGEQFDDLPIELSEEERVLSEIQTIRQQLQERDELGREALGRER